MGKLHDINEARLKRDKNKKSQISEGANQALTTAKSKLLTYLGDRSKYFIIYLLEISIRLFSLAYVLARCAVYLCIFSGALSMVVLFYMKTQTPEKFMVQLLTPVGMALIALLLKKITYWIAYYRHRQATKFGMVLKDQ